MKIFKSVLFLGAALLAFTFCSEKSNEDYTEREQAVFDEWMGRNHPTVTERLDNGMYIEWLKPKASSSKPGDTDFVAVDYRGYDLRGNLIANRDSTVARHEGTFTTRTHYVPHYAPANPAEYYLKKNTYYDPNEFTAGEYAALALMSAGDSVRIYMPSMLAYGTTSSDYQYGYEGWYNSYRNPKNISGSSYSLPSLGGSPAVVELALRRIDKDPEARELAEVVDKASVLGMAKVQDTIPGLYYKYIEPEDTKKDKIGMDSTFYMTYELRFLDGFLITTNDAEAAWEDWGPVSGSFDEISFTASSSSFLSNFGQALHEFIKSEKVRYDSQMQIVFVSEWGYYSGKAADSSLPTVVYPYTPLMMTIKTFEYGYDPDPEEEEEEE